MFNDRDTYDDKYRARDPPPTGGDGLDLLTDPIDAGGEPTSFTRERGNGRLVAPDPPDTGFGVDRNRSGRFASKDRAPTTQLRDGDGTVKSNPFAVGNFGTFGDDLNWETDR